MTDPKSMTLDDYPLQSYDKLRFSDTDRQGHVNNVVFSVFFETGRCEFLFHEGLLNPNASWALVKETLELVGEIHWPGKVWTGTGITKIGSSSLTLVQSCFQDDRLVCCGETVMVQMDNDTRKSSPLNEVARSFFEKNTI